MKIHVGDGLKFSGEWRQAGELANPSAQSLKVRAPSGVITDIVISSSAVGLWTGQFIAVESGIHTWRWAGSGSVNGADQGDFYVIPENI